ncbi:MAG: hypothetical protein VXW32_10845 [Myxococcota bacterium]|nr:hypothetical protein [Myxococcota bacterium]
MNRSNKPRPPPPRSRVYLWACSEGWIRLGPFEWVGLSEDRQAFLNQDGESVLCWDPANQCWRAWPTARFTGELWHPMVSSIPIHPGPKSGSFPVRMKE